MRKLASGRVKKKTTAETEDLSSSRKRKREYMERDDDWNELIKKQLKLKG